LLKEEKLIQAGYSKEQIHEACRTTLLHQVTSTKVHERRRLETISEIRREKRRAHPGARKTFLGKSRRIFFDMANSFAS
jgi:hypothetical protein